MTMGGLMDILRNPSLFAYTPVSIAAGVFACLYFVITVVYSAVYMKGRPGLVRYHVWLLLTLISALVVIFADNLLLLFTFWGLLGLLLYLLIGTGGGDHAPAAARKTLIIVGGTDVLMMLGLGLAWLLSKGPGSGLGGFLSMTLSGNPIPLSGGLAVTAWLCLASGALAKAGAMPFHTWVPDAAEEAPAPVTAFLPASLDKLLGILFLARISTELFRLTSGACVLLMALGSLTILAAVMMALVQHDFRRLLGYHAVSQVGYMVLGIGTGNPVGMAGALFHMFNNTIYKSSLFLAGGVVERRTGTADLSGLGGLARSMPGVFLAFLVASLSISGVPPLNGFASKWLIYKGVLASEHGGWTTSIWLVAAMLGSALTLASFMKLIHAIFLGQPSPGSAASAPDRRGAGPWAGLPLLVLSLLCVGLGVMAWRLPLVEVFRPLVGPMEPAGGLWHSGLVTALILGGFAAGFLVFLAGVAGKARSVDVFTGGEGPERHPEMRVSGAEFYGTVRDLPILRPIYGWAERRLFDIYNQGLKLLGALGEVFSWLHDGLLGRYLSWFLAGVVILYVVLIGRT